MNRKLSGALSALTLTLALSGCYTLNHTVGRGAQGNDDEEKRQWYALWGLVPFDEVDSQDLANGAQDYSVRTQWTPIDILINIFTGIVTITSRTVTVTK
jgi:hypothetical protein